MRNASLLWIGQHTGKRNPRKDTRIRTVEVTGSMLMAYGTTASSEDSETRHSFGATLPGQFHELLSDDVHASSAEVTPIK